MGGTYKSKLTSPPTTVKRQSHTHGGLFTFE